MAQVAALPDAFLVQAAAGLDFRYFPVTSVWMEMARQACLTDIRS
jgi:hypothetical protein